MRHYEKHAFQCERTGTPCISTTRHPFGCFCGVCKQGRLLQQQHSFPHKPSSRQITPLLGAIKQVPATEEVSSVCSHFEGLRRRKVCLDRTACRTIRIQRREPRSLFCFRHSPCSGRIWGGSVEALKEAATDNEHGGSSVLGVSSAVPHNTPTVPCCHGLVIRSLRCIELVRHRTSQLSSRIDVYGCWRHDSSPCGLCPPVESSLWRHVSLVCRSEMRDAAVRSAHGWHGTQIVWLFRAGRSILLFCIFYSR